MPLCHPLPITSIVVELEPDRRRGAIAIEATVRVDGKTGVEMEALTAVTVAALTVYDMAKAIDRGMTIGRVQLVAKSGGKSGDYRREGCTSPTPGQGRSRQPRRRGTSPTRA